MPCYFLQEVYGSLMVKPTTTKPRESNTIFPWSRRSAIPQSAKQRGSDLLADEVSSSLTFPMPNNP